MFGPVKNARAVLLAMAALFTATILWGAQDKPAASESATAAARARIVDFMTHLLHRKTRCPDISLSPKVRPRKSRRTFG